EEHQQRPAERADIVDATPDRTHRDADDVRAAGLADVDSFCGQVPHAGDGETDPEDDGYDALHSALEQKKAHDTRRPNAQSFENSKLTDALEHRHEHGIENQNAHGQINNEEHDEHEHA